MPQATDTFERAEPKCKVRGVMIMANGAFRAWCLSTDRGPMHTGSLVPGLRHLGTASPPPPPPMLRSTPHTGFNALRLPS